MKLDKENIYINLQGKSEEELKDLYIFLKLLNYNIDRFDSFLNNKYLHFNTNWNRWWTFSVWNKGDSKQEVTIQQLKEILQPMENLEQQLEKAKEEVKRIKKEIEDSKIKVGDWVISSLNNCIFKYEFGRLKDDLTKITDQELINKLNNLIK